MKAHQISVGMNIYWKQHNGCGNYSECFGRVQQITKKNCVVVRVLKDSKHPEKENKDRIITISSINKEVFPVAIP